MPDSEELQKDQTIEKSPANGGDQIHVEGIQDSTAVAIGRGARVTLQQYTEIIIKADNFEDLPPAPGEPPYKGLAYFSEADKDIYFGRETLSEQLVERLNETTFLALIGASGSGKSSLLRAGLIPRLRAHNWRIHLLSKPGMNPLKMLANNLTQEELDPASAVAIAEALANNPGTLAAVGEKLAARHGAGRLLLAVDQFEELFTQCKDAAERQTVVDNLVNAAQAEGATAVLISMRADFYDRVSEFAVLTDLVSQQQEYIKPMAQEDLVRVIAEPARLGGWQFVEGLVEQIVEDVGREPGRLPLLSHALLETWERRRGVVMTLGGYRDAGGVEGAIAQTAEETLHKLVAQNPAYENVCREIFLALTELGEGTEDTRRVAGREELQTAVAGEDLDAVLEALVAARLITMRSGEVEVAHEALIRRWPALKEWLADNRERLRFERQLGHDALLWEELGRDSGALYRGARLSQAVELQESGYVSLAGLADEFVAASRELEEREEREREEQRQHELENAQKLTAAALAREAAEIEARNAAEAQRTAEENARQQAEADASNLRRRALYLMGALAVAALLAIAAFIFFQNARSSAQEAEDNLAQATVALVAEATAAREAELNLAVANNNAATATRNLATAEAAKATSAYNEQQADSQAGTAVAAQAMAVAARGTAEAESIRTLTQSEKALAQSLQANSRALASNQPGSQDMTLARLLAVEGTGLTRYVGSPADQTGSASLLHSLAYDHPILNEPLQEVIFPTSSDYRFYDVALNGDGSRLATVSCSEIDDAQKCIKGKITIWDTDSLQQLRTLEEHTDWVYSVAWNGDSSRLASGSWDGTIVIWDTESWQRLITLTGHNDWVRDLAWSEDGRLLASTSCGGTNDDDSICTQGEIIIWNTASWQPLATLTGHSLDVLSAVWNNDGSRLASSSLDSTIIIWDTETWQPLATLSDHGSWVDEVAWNSDGSRLASASWDHDIIIWNTRDWEIEEILRDHAEGVSSLAWNGDGSRLASAAWDNKIIIWDAGNWEPLATLNTTERYADYGVTRLSWNKDGSRLASASEDGTILIWDTWQPMTTLTGHWETVGSATWSSDGGRLASTSGNKTIVWDAMSWQPLITLEGARHAAWNGDGSLLATASCGERDDAFYCIKGQVTVWDAESWRQVAILKDHTTYVNLVAWNRDGSRLASASDDGTVIIWDTESWQAEATLSDDTDWARKVAWNGDGRLLAADSVDGTIVIWGTDNWQPVTTLAGHTLGVSSIAWNEAGSLLASASCGETDDDSICTQGEITIWDAVSWQPLETLSDHTARVGSIAWNGDGSRLASDSYDDTVIIWDTKSWQPLTTLAGHATGDCSVAWNGDGSRLASPAFGRVRIWEFPDFEELQCLMARRNMSLEEWEQYLPGVDYRCTCAEWPAGEWAPQNAPGCASGAQS